MLFIHISVIIIIVEKHVRECVIITMVKTNNLYQNSTVGSNY